jgi:hypothetical protein
MTLHMFVFISPHCYLRYSAFGIADSGNATRRVVEERLRKRAGSPPGTDQAYLYSIVYLLFSIVHNITDKSDKCRSGGGIFV